MKRILNECSQLRVFDAFYLDDDFPLDSHQYDLAKRYHLPHLELFDVASWNGKAMFYVLSWIRTSYPCQFRIGVDLTEKPPTADLRNFVPPSSSFAEILSESRSMKLMVDCGGYDTFRIDTNAKADNDSIIWYYRPSHGQHSDRLPADTHAHLSYLTESCQFAKLTSLNLTIGGSMGNWVAGDAHWRAFLTSI
jgi:hypothetical protein